MTVHPPADSPAERRAAPSPPMERPTRVSDGSPLERVAGYSRAARRGPWISVSGTTATDAVASSPGGDTRAQTADALGRAIAAVEDLGGAPEDVIRTRLFLVERADWRAAADVHAELLGPVAPANTTLYVASLVGEQYLVEVEVDALLLGEAGA